MYRKTILFYGFLFLLVFPWLGFTPCRAQTGELPVAVEHLFRAKYPDADIREIEMEDGFLKVEFKFQGQESEAFFRHHLWVATTTKIRYRMLPQAVKEAFPSTRYTIKNIDDIYLIERPEVDPVYEIEIEAGDDDINLYYAADGNIVNAIAAYEAECHIDQIPAPVFQSFRRRYPHARFQECELENGRYEFELLDGGVKKEAYFSADGQWLYTQWEVKNRALPLAVVQCVQRHYAGYKIDEAHCYDTVKDLFYLLELEMGNREVEVKISPDGKLL